MADTISILEARGFTHLQRSCEAPGCPPLMSEISFARIRELRPRWMLSAMTVDEVRAKMPCKRCGSRSLSLTPVDRRAEAAARRAHSYPDYSQR